ncbi:MAG: ABC transporter substrate-binding protein [Acidobacteria bacterium]|jgi:peptide/nickel transport system substrate-binding protein|nr:ABC transporter substrate-binding protein [Acidobacteriota bacterium]
MTPLRPHRWTGLACLLLALTGSVDCGSPTTRPSDIIVIAMANSPTNFDPAVGLDEASQKIHQLLFSSLVKIDESLRVVPDLAVRVDWPDPLTYVAELPTGVRFHDGSLLSAADVAYTFNRFLDPEFVSGRKGAYRSLRAVEVIDETHVAFRLTEASASFPINLVMGIVPEGTGPEAARAPIGSGPYRLAEFAPDDHTTLAPFADYYQGRPNNAGLLLRVVPDETMRGLELRKGSVDLVINDLSPDIVDGLKQEPHLRVTTAEGTDFAYLGFNLRDSLLQDKRVRLAVGYAIDQQAIVRYLRRGLATPAIGIVPPMSWAHDPTVFRFERDVERAKALLDAAGYPDPDGDGPVPRLRLSLKTSTSAAYRLQAAVIQQNLAEAGIALELRSYEFATLFADVIRGNVQLYTLQWVGVTDPDMLRRVFHSSQIPPGGFNRGYYSNPDVDRLIDQATAALDEDQRGALYGEAQRLIAADAPYISLWYKTNVAVAHERLTGITLSPIADFSFLQHVGSSHELPRS